MNSLLNNRWLLLALRIGIGVMFIYAGTVKMFGPQLFADSIASFKLLPNAFISLLALGLPPFEIAAGALLLAGSRKRMAGLAILLLCSIFILALGQAAARGLEVDCGCFGSGPPSLLKTWLAFSRDIFLGGIMWFIYRNEKQVVT
jgi:uncharacterized membrane protein YphA (DoxX/SURF4 family)